MTIERDPRVDPRPGDVIRGKWAGRFREERTVKSVSKTRVVYAVPHLTCGCRLADWRTWAKTATIIKRGDWPSQPSEDNGND